FLSPLLPSRSLPASSFHSSGHLPHLHSFPTRRSSDLYPDEIPTTIAYDEQPLTSFLASSALRFPDKKALHFMGNEMTFADVYSRSEEHTSELQSRFDLVCRLLLEKKNKH